MVNFLTVAAKHCRKAEHSLSRYSGTAGFFKDISFANKESGMKSRMIVIAVNLAASMILAMTASAATFVDVARPLEAEGPTQVRVGIFIVDVDDIQTDDQAFHANVVFQLRWRDPRLAHDGPRTVSRPLDEVWNPQVQIVNQQKLWHTFPDIVSISPDGEVLYRQRVWGAFSQPLELREFPFDQQTFTIQLAAAGHGPHEVEMVLEPDWVSGIAERLSVPDWDILGWTTEGGPFRLTPKGQAPIAGFAFSFEGKRKGGYFIIKVIIPLILIVAMSWIVFWIDPKESGVGISVAITTMLTLIAYRFAVGAEVPRVSYLTRLDYFILGSTVLVYATLIEVVITSMYAKTERLGKARAIDRWSRWLFPGTFVLMGLDALVFSILI
ncbi:MAG: hypothetical protein JRF18_01585 [Deltaproteobacteria bacterium]|nr:hypothetical protein [Deltaproteobacteria bacterium]